MFKGSSNVGVAPKIEGKKSYYQEQKTEKYRDSSNHIILLLHMHKRVLQNKPQIVLVQLHKNHSPCILTILALNVKGPTFIKIKGDDPNDM